MASTVNFSGPVDGDLLKRAKVIAAKTGTSVNQLNALPTDQTGPSEIQWHRWDQEDRRLGKRFGDGSFRSGRCCERAARSGRRS